MTRGSAALEHTTFVFQPLGLTLDQAYALLTDNASGVLGDDDGARDVARLLDQCSAPGHVPEHRLTDAYKALKQQGQGPPPA